MKAENVIVFVSDTELIEFGRLMKTHLGQYEYYSDTKVSWDRARKPFRKVQRAYRNLNYLQRQDSTTPGFIRTVVWECLTLAEVYDKYYYARAPEWGLIVILDRMRNWIKTKEDYKDYGTPIDFPDPSDPVEYFLWLETMKEAVTDEKYRQEESGNDEYSILRKSE